LRFILPDIFHYEHSKELFAKAYNRGTFYRDEQFVEDSSAALKLLMIRRLKINLPELAIPAIEEIDIFLPISPAQRAIYKALLLRLDEGVLDNLLETDDNTNAADRQALQAMQSNKVVDSRVIAHLLSQLRKVSNHPYGMSLSYTLVLNADVDIGLTMARKNPDNFVNCSSKLMALDRLLPFLKANGSRPLMFSQSTKMLTLLEAYCDIRGHKYVSAFINRLGMFDWMDRPRNLFVSLSWLDTTTLIATYSCSSYLLVLED
jgi:SWI/SNF-related matrix-associated actin-dependent regulator of chromatin subfamily A member 5